MESKVCIVNNPKRNHSDDDGDDNNRDSKQKRRHDSRDRHTARDKYDKGSGRRYADLKVGDPYYSGGALSDNRKDGDRKRDDSRDRRRHRSRDRRREKENRSRNAENVKEGKIGASYYAGGIAAVERESGEESSDSDDDDKIGQRYYSTETADTQRKNSESYWNKYAKKDKKLNVCDDNVVMCRDILIDLILIIVSRMI